MVYFLIFLVLFYVVSIVAAVYSVKRQRASLQPIPQPGAYVLGNEPSISWDTDGDSNHL